MLASTIYNYHARVGAPETFGRETNVAMVASSEPSKCWANYSTAVKLVSTEADVREGLFAFFGHSKVVKYKVRMTNLDNQTMKSSFSIGGFYLSGQELNPDGSLAKDGIRSAIIGELAPGESQIITVVRPIRFDSKKSRYIISPVQEGCAWTYLVNPKTSVQVE
jgi:hypothetical protein